ncbi:MAG: serine hydrolase domain-containing protein [Rubripirellula sp.]
MDKTSPTGSNRKMTPHREALTFAARPRLRFFEHLVCNLSISAFATAVRISLLALVLGLSQDACASSPSATAGLSVGRASEVGVDPQILNQAAALIRETVAEKEIPGAVILIAREGKIILHHAFGHRDLQCTLPMQTDSLFRMASNSKAITAAGIMLLVEDGKLDLDKPVGTYLHAFRNERWRAITLRHLLTHTSGIRIKPLFLTPLIQRSATHPHAPDLRLEVDRFAAIAPLEPAGKTYSYNNACYNTLAAVIEEVTGSYKQHLRDRIYKPMGMLDSCNHESDANHDRMSTVLRRQRDGSWSKGWQPGDAPDWPFPRGSGGMISSSRDYALFCQMLLNQGQHGNQQILSSDSVREMTNPQGHHCEAAINYGLGWKVSEAGGTFSHTGSDGTFVWVDPHRNLIGMVLTQCNGVNPPRAEFRQLVESACITPEGVNDEIDSE